MKKECNNFSSHLRVKCNSATIIIDIQRDTPVFCTIITETRLFIFIFVFRLDTRALIYVVNAFISNYTDDSCSAASCMHLSSAVADKVRERVVWWYFMVAADTFI